MTTTETAVPATIRNRLRAWADAATPLGRDLARAGIAARITRLATRPTIDIDPARCTGTAHERLGLERRLGELDRLLPLPGILAGYRLHLGDQRRRDRPDVLHLLTEPDPTAPAFAKLCLADARRALERLHALVRQRIDIPPRPPALDWRHPSEAWQLEILVREGSGHHVLRRTFRALDPQPAALATFERAALASYAATGRATLEVSTLKRAEPPSVGRVADDRLAALQAVFDRCNDTTD